MSVLTQAPIVAFVATVRPDQARAFYVDVLGLQLTSDDPFALAFDAGGTMLRVAKVEHFDPAGFTVLGWEVPDIRAAVAELGAHGVSFQRFAFMQQDDDGIWSAPGGAQVAWFKDPDGNTLSVTQMPAAAQGYPE